HNPGTSGDVSRELRQPLCLCLLFGNFILILLSQSLRLGRLEPSQLLALEVRIDNRIEPIPGTLRIFNICTDLAIDGPAVSDDRQEALVFLKSCPRLTCSCQAVGLRLEA